jgi:hypothetical protein
MATLTKNEPKYSESVNIKFTKGLLAETRARAAALGVGLADYIRMVVIKANGEKANG